VRCAQNEFLNMFGEMWASLSQRQRVALAPKELEPDIAHGKLVAELTMSSDLGIYTAPCEKSRIYLGAELLRRYAEFAATSALLIEEKEVAVKERKSRKLSRKRHRQALAQKFAFLAKRATQKKDRIDAFVTFVLDSACDSVEQRYAEEARIAACAEAKQETEADGARAEANQEAVEEGAPPEANQKAVEGSAEANQESPRIASNPEAEEPTGGGINVEATIRGSIADGFETSKMGDRSVAPQLFDRGKLRMFAPATRQKTATSSMTSASHDAVMHQLLHEDIIDMATSLDMIVERRRPWMLAVAEKVKAVIYHYWPGAWADVFGSVAMGLAVPSSDVDIVVRGIRDHLAPSVASTLKGMDWVQGLTLITHTTIPLIRLTTALAPISFGNKGSLISVDITFENFKHTGLNTKELVNRLQRDFPPLKPLTLILKQFLIEKGLNDPYLGGLKSYGLVIMITSCLQRFCSLGNIPSLGFLLCEFLREFADISRINRKISITGPNNNLPSITEYGLGILFIEDPLDLTNNIGSTCHGIRQVQQAFAEALDAIRLSATVIDADRSMMSSWSLLGHVFTAGHHRNVCILAADVWCPQENAVLVDDISMSAARRSSGGEHAPNLKLWALRACGVIDRIVRDTTREDDCPLCSSGDSDQQRTSASRASVSSSWDNDRLHGLIPEHHLLHDPRCPLVTLLRDYNNIFLE